MKFISILIILLIIISCQSKSQNDIQKTSQIYVDLLVGEETYRGMPDSLIDNRILIFSKYETTEEEYNESFLLMEKNKEEWNKFYENALSYLDTLRAKGQAVQIEPLQVQP